MQAWVSAFGKPLLCLIEADGQARAFAYVDDQSQGVPLAACELLPRGVIVVYNPCEENDGD
jgi:hypothetical protein